MTQPKGLGERSNDGIFLQVKYGGIVRVSKEPREGFEAIVVTDPRSGQNMTKYIKRYSFVDAFVKDVEWYDREQGDQHYMGWKLSLDANGTKCSLDLPFESASATRFMKMAEMVDWSEPVEFSAWKTPDDKTAFTMKQNGVNVPQKYTRENPGDCPPPVQGFNKKWNFDAQKQFLHARMVNVVIPAVRAFNALNGTHEETESTEGAADQAAEIGDPLEAIRRSIKGLAGTKVVNGADEDALLEQYFGTKDWGEIEKLPAGLLRAQAVKLDELIPF